MEIDNNTSGRTFELRSLLLHILIYSNKPGILTPYSNLSLASAVPKDPQLNILYTYLKY